MRYMHYSYGSMPQVRYLHPARFPRTSQIQAASGYDQNQDLSVQQDVARFQRYPCPEALSSWQQDRLKNLALLSASCFELFYHIHLWRGSCLWFPFSRLSRSEWNGIFSNAWVPH